MGKRHTGYWIEHDYLFKDKRYECSECGDCTDDSYDYCPSCGALMRKIKYDPAWVDDAEMMSAFLDDDY